jgi:hypothetical protein
MGSITSSPKLPAAQQPLVINLPSASPQASAGSAPAAEASAAKTPTREDNLLARGRGVLGTVLTGLRGVLADTTPKTSSRKTLLGE